MILSFYAACEAALMAGKEAKLAQTEAIAVGLREGIFSFESSEEPKRFESPSCARFCQVVSPFEVKRRQEDA